MGQVSVRLRAVRSDVFVGAQAVGNLSIIFHTRNVPVLLAQGGQPPRVN